MKKLLTIGVMALFCAVACQQEPEQVVPDNPTYNPTTQEVTAEFVLSVANGQSPSSRMTGPDVQADGSFRGMSAVHLLTYELDYTYGTGTAANPAPAFLYKPTDASSKATRDYDLGSAIQKDEISADKSSKVFQMSLPLGTNAVLFYGRSIKTKTSDEQGNVVAAGDLLGKDVANNVTFTLGHRLSSTTNFQKFNALMSRILTGVLLSGRYIENRSNGNIAEADNQYRFYWPIDKTSQEWMDEKDYRTVDGDGNVLSELENGNNTFHQGYTFYKGEKKWRDYGVAYSNIVNGSSSTSSLKPLEEILGEAYYNVTTLRTNGQTPNTEGYAVELRAGSNKDVLKLASDIYFLMYRVTHSSPSGPEDYIAQLVAADVIFRAGRFFTGTTSTLSWRDYTSFASNVRSYVLPPDGYTNWDAILSMVENDDKYFYRGVNQPGFPINLGLPSGAALMKFVTVSMGGNTTIDAVNFLENIPNYGMGGTGATALSVDNYRYPAEIMYWTNSPLRTNDNSVKSADYPTTVSSWDNESWNGSWSLYQPVKSTTRAVAVVKEINYGTALLNAQFKYGATTIYDNNSGLHPKEDDRPIATSSLPFKVTGVVIGGINDQVGWDFLPTAEAQFDKMIYDKYTTPVVIPASGNSASNYTLVWDNFNSSLTNGYTKTDGQSPVYIALELVNQTTEDLWGGLNVIHPDGVFYLVGKLDPNAAGAAASLNKDSNQNIDLSRPNFYYPPYKEDGSTFSCPRVFMQDYETTVVFSLNPHSLRNAYVTMPDLRASNVSLGVSVDLVWEKGLNFDNIPLGGISD